MKEAIFFISGAGIAAGTWMIVSLALKRRQLQSDIKRFLEK